MIAVSCCVCALGLAAILLRLRRYRSWFSAPTQRDDQLPCRDTRTTIPIRIESAGFSLPPGVDLQGRSVFLRLAVNASVLGFLLDPCIEMSDGARTLRQYFERGASGQRYLNLSPFFQQDLRPGRRFGLRGRVIRWAAEATLWVYDRPPIEGATVLVLAPHPDDAEIAAFGMYADRLSWVVTLTAGERETAHVPKHIPPDKRARWAASLRVADSLIVPGMGGVPPARRANLVFPDGALEAMYREPSRPFSLAGDGATEEEEPLRCRLRSTNNLEQWRSGRADCTWNELVEELRWTLESTRPDIVVCPHPLIDIHPDHVYATVALEQALRTIHTKPSLFLLYSVHHSGARLYPYGLASSVVSLPPGHADQWLADSIYSHSLEPQTQQTKYFAIEAMHATRSCNDGMPQSLRQVLKSLRQQIAAAVAGMSLDPSSFLRRAPRPNEIYYVVRAAGLSELIGRLPNLRSQASI